MQKLLKAQCFMNEMHEYEMKNFSKTSGFNPDLSKKSFSETLEFNPDLPKIRFSINLSSNLKL